MEIKKESVSTFSQKEKSAEEINPKFNYAAAQTFTKEQIDEELKKLGMDPLHAGSHHREKAIRSLQGKPIFEEKPDAPKEVKEQTEEEKQEEEAREMKRKVEAERMAKTVLEGKAGLAPGWPHEHIPVRSALPPTWEEHELSVDHRSWIIYKEVEKKKKKPKGTKKHEKDEMETLRSPHLLVTMGGCLERDGKKWMKIGISQRVGYPSWQNIKEVKSYLLGPEAFAYMVLPPETEQSSAGTVMYMFHCVDTEKPGGQYLPDFTGGTGIV